MVSSSLMCETTSLSKSDGVEAPAVIPISSESLFAKAGGISAALSTKMVLLHRSAQVRNSLRVFALFLPPTTIIASAREASSQASCWRISVALQMVQWLSGCLTLRSMASRVPGQASGGYVVWETMTASSISGSFSASSAEATNHTGPWAHPAVP